MTYLVENSVSGVDRSQTITDWEILNHANSTRLKRILASSSEYEPANVEEACSLISAYHQVYRKNLIQLRHRGYIGLCQPPTSEQLQRIAHLQNKDGITAPQQILIELQKLAQLLR